MLYRLPSLSYESKLLCRGWYSLYIVTETLMNHCLSNCEKALFKSEPVSSAKKFTSILGSLGILLLPKCPFCVVAYSSTITLCGASGVMTDTEHHNDWGAYLAVGMSLLITLIILASFKIQNKLFPYLITLAFALCGSAFIYVAGFEATSMTCYYIGAALLIAATLIYGGAYFHLKSFLNTVNK